MNLKSMSVVRLTTLREKVDTTLQAKVAEARRVIEAELEKLSRFGGAPGRSAAGGKRGGSRVLPKYRNPENPSETWAGRGLRPRWLTAALKGGHKLEDFLIEGAPARKAKPAAKPRKAAAPKKAKSRKAASPKAPRKPRTLPAAAPKAEEPEATTQATS